MTAFRLIICTLILVAGFQSAAHACRPLISTERTNEVIENAAFIGIAKAIIVDKADDKTVNYAILKPVFVYKMQDTFDPKPDIKITFDQPRSSCDYEPVFAGQLMEVIIYKEENGAFRLGNRADMAIGDAWEGLRESVRYVE